MDPQSDVVKMGRPEGYEAPALSFHGSVGQHTAALSSGGFTDATFPTHTPLGDLTFSG
ncbi:MAG TPA: hypothetical protein VFW24_02505 [Acidimicrobiales bacterium]|nr:hypothetical protein [Acidimicrobiales bacterium]